MSTNLPARLIRPSGYLVPRVVDQLSFCYIHMAQVTQDKTGVLARMETQEGERRAYLPTAAIAALLLGPGVSITQSAITTLARHGTTIVFVGQQGTRFYSSIPGSSNTELLLLAARTAVDDGLRLSAARRLYGLRFDDDIPEHFTLEQLRGFEGARMRATYQALAKQHRIAFRRQYTFSDFDAADPVNQALSSANTCLYGVVGAALASLGIPSGLGIVHTGARESLVYDIADIYKAEITIPLAFACASEDNPSTTVRRKLRNRITLTRLLPRIVRDIRHVYGLADRGHRDDPRDVVLTRLWDGDGEVPGGTNYADGGPGALPADPAGAEDW